MQNEPMVQQAIQNLSFYPMPIGSAGVSMIDARDIADVAVAELLRPDRLQTLIGHPLRTYEDFVREAVAGV
ncbi:Oxidoreductase [Pseudomonas sp. E141]|jgi:uncharacterized protein YbjT (DUF2867 family)